jgi:uncharacterized protein (TIGR03435 family)
MAFALIMVVARAVSAQSTSPQGIAPLPPMAAGADPSFEVATVKPGNPDAQGGGFPSRGRNFAAQNCTVSEMLRFAFSIRPEQILNAPAWMDKDRFDIDGVPDTPGLPDSQQWKTMLQKLLADRFQLTFHREKRVLSVYLLTAGKNGAKLTPSSNSASASSDINVMLGRDGFLLMAHGITLGEFASALQAGFLARPVVDQTGIAGRFEIRFTFAPNGTEFGGVNLPAQNADSSAPSIFTAVQDLGLKLEPTKAAIDVLVIDHADHPTPD